jgi:hypothetical protein
VKTRILVLLSASIAVGIVAPALAHAQGRDPEAQRRRNQIRLMEGVLVQAVRLGAEEVSKEMERFEPTGVTVLSGMPRARGFVLDGHGVFFDVEIPDMNQSVVWSVMNVQRDRQVGTALEMLRTAMKSMPEGPSMQQAQLALAAVEKIVGPSQQTKNLLAAETPARGQVNAAAMPDPNVMYTEAVKTALVEAMLDHSLQMSLGPEEWLIVAARDNEGPLSPAGLSDAITITLRVKGSDLAVYHADPARRSEIREKVKADAKVF